jgi:DnaK suppressor protein
MGAIVVEHHQQPRHEGGDPDCKPRTEHCDLHVNCIGGREALVERRYRGDVSPNATSTGLRRSVEQARDAARQRIVELDRSFADIAASVDTANTDDEHDPEGATLAFERAQVVSLLAEARARLDALDAAAARIDQGTYGVCERCGGPIGDERLAALPGARRCVDCARTQ